MEFTSNQQKSATSWQLSQPSHARTHVQLHLNTHLSQRGFNKFTLLSRSRNDTTGARSLGETQKRVVAKCKKMRCSSSSSKQQVRLMLLQKKSSCKQGDAATSKRIRCTNLGVERERKKKCSSVNAAAAAALFVGPRRRKRFFANLFFFLLLYPIASL